MKKIIWITSYPKSGNTWMRYLIANYFFNKEKKENFNISEKILYFPIPSYLEKLASRDQLLMNPYNISKYWIKIQEEGLRSVSDDNVVFLKNHNALVSIEGNDFTNENLSIASIYIVRDPRDVVVSYSHYKNSSYDEVIDILCSKKLYYNFSKSKKFPQIEILGSWQFNYTSWRDGVPKMEKHLVRYEDLIDDCHTYFSKTVDFLTNILNTKTDRSLVDFSIDVSAFAKLKAHEKKSGFKQNEGKSVFFRSGKKGQWKNSLKLNQIKKIENAFKNEMQDLGYL